MQRSFTLPVNVVHATAPVAGSFVWSMRNTGVKPGYLRQAFLNASFTGTGAATTSAYQLQRFRTATPTGGAALTIINENTHGQVPAVVSVFGDARVLATGLTIAGVASDTPFAFVGVPRGAPGAVALFCREWADANDNKARFLIPPGDGLAIALGADAVAGDAIQGFINWVELD